MVALTGGPEGDTLIRRAARIADRSAGGDLLAVHVTRSDGLAAGTSHASLARQRRLVEDLGGSYHSVVGDDVATALVEFARAENATQLVLGTSRRGRLERFVTGRGTGETVVELSGDIDIHMVTHERAGRGTLLPSRRRTLSTARLDRGPGRRPGAAGGAHPPARSRRSPGQTQPHQRGAALPARRGGGGLHRRGRVGGDRLRDGVAAAQLLVHPAHRAVHHARAIRTPCWRWWSSRWSPPRWPLSSTVRCGCHGARPAPPPRRRPCRPSRAPSCAAARRSRRCWNVPGRPSAWTRRSWSTSRPEGTT